MTHQDVLSHNLLKTDEPAAAMLEEEELTTPINEVGDDRDDIRDGDQVMLIIENDTDFARFLMDTAREHGFKCLVTALGATALSLTRDHRPEAIMLDIHLPDMEGWRVLERLKNEISMRHIPVCVVSTDESRTRAFDGGAISFMAKPIHSRDVIDGFLQSIKSYLKQEKRSVLVVDSDAARRERTEQLLAIDNIKVRTAKDKQAAAKILRKNDINCIIAHPDVNVSGLSGDDSDSMLHSVSKRIPIIVYGEDCEGYDASHFKIQSPERLLDVVSYYLHYDVRKLPSDWRDKIFDLRQSTEILAGKKVLVVDDDARNIFALTSVLEEHEMVVESADNGRDAISILQENPDIDIVLMDIMMPEMDGMETIREIRKIEAFRNLPVIAVTAKAMKGDREKCIEAGAWDYLSKPVDIEQMLNALRAWLFR